mmetsp:Transcript_60371/g.112024  ORF Transcript_60371/g.112024 Transcript_60371/m.112024 type:complete len:204 (+) Transcript_60371:237-848(+)
MMPGQACRGHGSLGIPNTTRPDERALRTPPVERPRSAQAKYAVHLEVGCGRAPPNLKHRILHHCQSMAMSRNSTQAQKGQRWVRFACACAGGRIPSAAVYDQPLLAGPQPDCLASAEASRGRPRRQRVPLLPVPIHHEAATLKLRQHSAWLTSSSCPNRPRYDGGHRPSRRPQLLETWPSSFRGVACSSTATLARQQDTGSGP